MDRTDHTQETNMTATAAKPAPSNVVTPTGVVHRGGYAKHPFTGKIELVPACQRGSKTLRYALPTDATATCKRCS